MASPICSPSLPGPGAGLTLPAGTLAPRSLSHSKLPVPNTKLLPLAKRKKKREGENEGKGKYRAKGEGKSPFRRHFGNWEQPGRPELGNRAGRSSLMMCPPLSETKHQGVSHDHGPVWASATLKQEPWRFIPNVSPLARTTHLLWNQDTRVAPTQALAPPHSLACPKVLPGCLSVGVKGRGPLLV